jgi:copper ion binding protein
MVESNEQVYLVPGASCGHCVDAISEAVSEVEGVQHVHVDLATKRVTVEGQADQAAVRAAISEAGYELVA